MVMFRSNLTRLITFSVLCSSAVIPFTGAQRQDWTLSAPTGSPVFLRGSAHGDLMPPLDVDVLVTIACANRDGVDCNELVRQCSTESPVTNLSLQYIGGPCTQSSHTQGPHSTAMQYNNGPDNIQDAHISCQSSGAVLFNETVSVGDVITTPSDLESSLMCTISVDDSTIQEISIDAAGSVDLFLDDVFCSLKVLGCHELTCEQDVTYAYTMSNTASIDAQLVSVDRTRNGDERSLLALAMLKLGSSTLLSGGRPVRIYETDTFDICSGRVPATSLVVEASAATDDRTVLFATSLEIDP